MSVHGQGFARTDTDREVFLRAHNTMGILTRKEPFLQAVLVTVSAFFARQIKLSPKPLYHQGQCL